MRFLIHFILGFSNDTFEKEMVWIYQLLLIVAGAFEVSVTDFSLNKYHSYEELSNFLHGLATENTDITRLYSIGKSFEGTLTKARITYIMLSFSFCRGLVFQANLIKKVNMNMYMISK